MTFLDCTLRDGGYYNGWDFSSGLVTDYLQALASVGVDVVELGFRSLKGGNCHGPHAFTTDEFISSLAIPHELTVGVMVNASELIGASSLSSVLERLFPERAEMSRLSLVRIACHAHEVDEAVPAVRWLHNQGYMVGLNLMQVSDRSMDEVSDLVATVSDYPLDVLYFADSLGGMTPEQTSGVIAAVRKKWAGPVGIHAHDNMGLALQNTLRSLDEGVSWVDATVMGMGRGPGNTRTEELAVELAERCGKPINSILLMDTIKRHFHPLHRQHGWGMNLYYYLAGRYGIHPTYIQEMLTDTRYDEAEIFAVINHLRREGGKSFSFNHLDAARNFFQGAPNGTWNPEELVKGREVLLLGNGLGAERHKQALESYIHRYSPLVMALNTKSAISESLISVRAACHPVRLLADCGVHQKLQQPLITPFSMLPEEVRGELAGKTVCDYGIEVKEGSFNAHNLWCTLPTTLVAAYALAVINGGKATRVLMAGFDGFGGDDPRSHEMQRVLELYQADESSPEAVAVTPTRYTLPQHSIYAL